MAHPLSTLGIVHTVISVVPVLAGLHCLIRDRRIDHSNGAGRFYLVSLALSVVTSFGLSSTGRINAGHVLGVVAMLAALSPLVIEKLKFLGRLQRYAMTFGPSFSFFLLLVPGINETLSRLPVAHPLATGPEDPLVKMALLGWLLIFVVAFATQCWAIHAGRVRAR